MLESLRSTEIHKIFQDPAGICKNLLENAAKNDELLKRENLSPLFFTTYEVEVV